MSGWAMKSLGDICDVRDGTHDSPKQHHVGKPLVTSKNLKNGAIFLENTYLISEADFLQINRRSKVDLYDILFSMIGTVGEMAIVKKEPAFAIKNVGLFKCHRDYDLSKWIYYYMKSSAAKEEILAAMKGSTQAYIALGDLRKFPIAIPPLPEQKAIAAVLNSLDDKIDLLHRQNKTLEAMAETLFRQWFVEEAQENWEEVAVSDFVKLNLASLDKNYPHTIIEYLDTGSLAEGRIENLQAIDLNEAPSRARRLVQHNDILISTVRPDQKHYGIIKNPADNLVVSTGFCVLTCTKIDPHFIYLLLTNDEMTDYLHSIAEGSTSTYPSLKPSDIGAVTFQMPPNERLKEFSAIAHHSWEKIEKNHIQIRTLEKLRDTLLPKLISGEVRINL